MAAGIVAAAGAAWYVAGPDGGTARAAPSAAEAAADAERARSAQRHEVALFSYAYSAAGGAQRSSLPVVVTLDVKGRDGLGAVCNAMPWLREAVLRVFGAAPVIVTRRARDGALAPLSAPLRDEINRIVAGGPVQGVRAQLLRDAAAGGAAARRTDDACREFVES